MKKSFLFLAALFVSSLFGAPQNSPGNPLVFIEPAVNKSNNKAAAMDAFPPAVMHKIINTRRFDVCRTLDDLKKLQKERLANNGDKGAFIIRMTITRYSIAEEETRHLNKKVKIYAAEVVAQIEYTDAMTGKVLESKRAEQKWDVHGYTVGKIEKDVHSFRAEALERVIQGIAEQCVDRFMEMLYPLKLLRVTGKTVYINAGQDRLAPNELLNLYKIGEAFIDHDTGENLGADEEYTARIKVVQAKQKYSIAEVIDGEIKGKRTDYILRKCSTEQIAAPETEQSGSSSADSDPHGANPF